MKNRIFQVGSLLGIFLFLAYSAAAQSKRERHWNEAIAALESSDFVKEYTKNKELIEEKVAAFQQQKMHLVAADVEDIHKHYNIVVDKFDAILNEMKHDYTNKENRQFITTNPDRYAKQFTSDLNDAMGYYKNNCEQKIDALIQPTTGAFGIMEVQLLIALGGELWKLVDKWQDKMDKMTEAYFERNFIDKLRLKRWDSY